MEYLVSEECIVYYKLPPLTKSAHLNYPCYPGPMKRYRPDGRSLHISEGRYEAKIAETADEVKSALRLRFEVFNRQMGAEANLPSGLEFDQYDFRCKHLIVREKESGRTVGTYRMAEIDPSKGASAFYSHSEFSIEDLPEDVLQNGIEIGRACVALEHRNSKVLFLLWKGLARYLLHSRKRYFFGCCSIFSTDEVLGCNAYHKLLQQGSVDGSTAVKPRKNAIAIQQSAHLQPVKLPGLFEMYLRLGAKVCGPPIKDNDFGTIDFFVILDLDRVPKKYREMFFSLS